MSTLALRNLGCRYDVETVISDISFTVATGEIIALIGPNGSGKTTLMRAMCRALKPAQGEVLLNGKNIWQMPIRHVARNIARVEQGGRIAWPFTVHQLVNLGRFPHRGWISSYTPDDHQAVDRAIRETGLWDHRSRVISTLSGGENQRAMIARALAQKPTILLLDEPVAHLDIKYKITVLDLVRQLSRDGLSVVVSLHDLNLAGIYADRIALLSKGRLFALGGPAAILTEKNLETVYETEVLVGNHPLNHRPLVTPIPSWMKKQR